MSAADTLDLAPFDAADYLTTPEQVAAYLNAALAENDPAILEEALQAVARSPALMAARRGAAHETAPASDLKMVTKRSYTALFATAKTFGFRLQVVRP